MREVSRTISGTNSVQREGWEDGEYYCETEFFDKKQLEQNDKIRNSGMLDKGVLNLHDGADYRAVISIPSTLQYSIFKIKHHETYKLLTSVDSEEDRLKGIRQLAIIEPDWVIYSRL